MNYTLAKVFKPKTGNDWYVYYSVRNPETGELVRFKEREGLNRIKNLKDRKHEFTLLASGINEMLKKGWSPFQVPDQEKETKDKNRANFYWWFDEKIANELARGDAGYYNWKNLTQVKKMLVEYSATLLVKDLDYKFLTDFETHRLKKGNGLNYIEFIMSKVKAVLSIIINSGDLPHHKNPFLKYRTKTTPITPKRITLEDIHKLEKIKLVNKSEDQARDMYIFSFYQAGMRFGDICRVKKEWFSEGHTNYAMNKSKNDRRIKIMPEVKKLIEKYKEVPGEYLFDTKVNWSQASKSIDARNTFYNTKLKEACKKAKIPEISFHTSRHSLADIAHSKNIGIKKIKDLLGHSKITTTERYMKKFYREETDESMDEIYGK